MARIETIPALVVREPFLELILLGAKTIEVRHHFLPIVGETVLLCSSSSGVDDRAIEDVSRLPRALYRRVEPKLDWLHELRGKTAALVSIEAHEEVPHDARILSLEEEAKRAFVPARKLRGKHLFHLGAVTRLAPVPTARVSPAGRVVPGGFLGVFPAPRSIVHFRGEEELLR